MGLNSFTSLSSTTKKRVNNADSLTSVQAKMSKFLHHEEMTEEPQEKQHPQQVEATIKILSRFLPRQETIREEDASALTNDFETL
jgi:hypothetical protein